MPLVMMQHVYMHCASHSADNRIPILTTVYCPLDTCNVCSDIVCIMHSCPILPAWTHAMSAVILCALCIAVLPGAGDPTTVQECTSPVG
jgi:hypothetical protein